MYQKATGKPPFVLADAASMGLKVDPSGPLTER